MLNSFWEKFCQQENQGKTCIVNDSREYNIMLVNPSIYFNTVMPVYADILIVHW